MHRKVYRYHFKSSVAIEDIEATLLLAIMGAEGIHGESQARLDVGHLFDGEHRVCVIDADTPVGCDLNRLFVSFLNREFGPDAFTVTRVAKQESTARTRAHGNN